MANTMSALQALNAVFTKEQAEVLLALLPEAGEDYGPAIDALTSRVGSVEGEVEGKADAQHTHAIGDVSGLQAALNGKANTSHTHAIGNVTGLQDALDGKQPAGSYAAASHTHTIANVSGLQAALDGKAASSHTHAIADISGLEDSLSDIEARLEALESAG